MFTLKEQAENLSCMILRSIQRTDANLIVTPCGLCQLNLEIARKRIWKKTSDHRSLHIINIGQLVGLALDLGPQKTYMNEKKILAMRGITSTLN
jgi:succinate dehydrogenase / fumarate reductase cytochrome b subunit